MKPMRIMIALLALAMVASAQQPPQKDRTATAFDQLKSLAGEWEATANEGGKEMSAPITFRLASGGSVLMSDLAPGMPHEMITMFHRDGDDLLATHYCLTGNQPRMHAVLGGEANSVAFELKDITNLTSSTAPHMVGVKFTFVDANHHIEEWTTMVNGQKAVRRFECRRKASGGDHQ